MKPSPISEMASPRRVLTLLLTAFPLGSWGAAFRKPSAAASCRNLPGDAAWPSQSQWAQLNSTVGGRLIATVQLASVCHTPNINSAACKQVEDAWHYADEHVRAPAEFLAPYFQNQSCDPFSRTNQPCVLGNYAQYSINVVGISDVQAGIKFAQDNNIRLTIKNTGHDLLGKSTGKGALSLWTHNLNSIEWLDQYSGDASYSGKAVRLGAGVMTQDVFTAANQRNVRVVTGTCPTVGVAGGYTSGGGHGIFTSKYGMAADNVLEWEVVTAAGVHLVATPTSNADLYWALSGGGGGTFAVVLSMVTRVYSDGPIAGASLSFDVNSAGSVSKFWDGVATFQSSLSAVVDAGAVVSYSLTTTALTLYGVALPDANTSTLDSVMQPLTTAMSNIGINLQVAKTQHTGFLDYYNYYFKTAVTTTPAAQITGGRLIPRSLMQDLTKAKAVGQTFRTAVEAGFVGICDAVNANQPHLHDNAVNPIWRSAVLHCIFIRMWDFTIPRSDMVAYQNTLSNTIMPQIEAATPGGGAYLNEANFQQANWQSNFYGSSYTRLKQIKDQVDQGGVFYAQTAVGSEEWMENFEQRLCPA
ncbi:putative FAD linked N-terminal [Rosellinia necatrix]|uniref:Putative FAD linked N-terminal n=1 Tax=Rosellinia necatrix TaxID=77044 RepID=A0A1W2TFP4_ROSNE|nr:putative FAD linked N-terminal [Rosellinia necatrix]